MLIELYNLKSDKCPQTQIVALEKMSITRWGESSYNDAIPRKWDDAIRYTLPSCTSCCRNPLLRACCEFPAMAQLKLNRLGWVGYEKLRICDYRETKWSLLNTESLVKEAIFSWECWIDNHENGERHAESFETSEVRQARAHSHARFALHLAWTCLSRTGGGEPTFAVGHLGPCLLGPCPLLGKSKRSM